MAEAREWGGSLHQTFRLLPGPAANLEAFLGASGLTQAQVLQRLPYDAARSNSGTGAPDGKRYRDGRHVYQTAGLLYESDAARVVVTELGQATRRWIGLLTPGNAPLLGRHAAYALSAAQLRNPSKAGRIYGTDVEVFPFAFIWRAMLRLDNRISSDELNRCIFRVANEDELEAAIEVIRACRAKRAPVEYLGAETISGPKRNDRVIPWIALASFGWLLIADKRETGSSWYEIRDNCRNLLQEASQMKRRHQEFSSMAAYVEHISASASLPKDVR